MLTHFRISPTLSYNSLTDTWDISFLTSPDRVYTTLEDAMTLLTKVSRPEKRLPDIPETEKCTKDPIAKDILAFTDAHPYYTQQLASDVYDKMTYSHLFNGVVGMSVSSQVQQHDLDYERLWLTMNRTDRYELEDPFFGRWIGGENNRHQR